MTIYVLKLVLQDELEQMLAHDSIKNRPVPVLFFANKVLLCIHSLAVINPWRVQV